ncbi:ribonuclease T2 [Cladorrhinum sp. PSN259]|nr:ribonuclease T2 [Cladorrhinum sp. PSN259]
MPSSLPVPSKAALTVLRGLALGTSCTIALIVEDRRRRINNAVRVINNGDKIKSCRKYHSGGKALAAALEQEVVVDASLFKPPREDGEENTASPGRQKAHDEGVKVTEAVEAGKEGSLGSRPAVSAENEKQNDPFAVLIAASATSAPVENLQPNTFKLSSTSSQGPKLAVLSPNTSESAPTMLSETQPREPFACLKEPENSKPSPFEPPNIGSIGMPTWSQPASGEMKESQFPSNHGFLAKVHHACDTKNYRELAAAIRNVLDAFEANVAPDNQDAQWLGATARLCKTCQELGRIDDAATILGQVVKRGPISQGHYVAHDPASLLEALIVEAGSPDSGKHAYNAKLDILYQIFMAKYEVVAPDFRLYKVGAKLLEMADLVNVIWRRQWRYLFQRCNNLALAADNASHSLTQWFITKLYEAMSCTAAIETFLWTYQRAPQTPVSIIEVANIVVNCVKSANNHRADHVLKGLCKLCAESLGSMRLNSRWVVELLAAHWKRYGDFDQTEALFQHLGAEDDLSRVVLDPESIFRIMVELSLEAGDENKARSYFDSAVVQGLVLESNVRMLGVFAKYHAKKGNWEDVRKTFGAMEVDKTDPKAMEMYGKTFVPVLKIYAEHHTVNETDNFMRLYMAEFNVPVNKFLVTLMAKEYAKLRDVDSIVGWLDYCAHSGFKVDAAFSNAILVNIRRHWNMPFRDLRTLFRKLRELSPDFIDEHTEQFMAKAAVTASRYGGSAAIGRLLSLRLTKHKVSPKVPIHANQRTNRQLIEEMRAKLVCGCPRSAWLLYRKVTVEKRLPFHEYVLRLALKALLQMDSQNLTRAFELVRQLKDEGKEVTGAINYLLAVQIGNMKFEYDEAALPAVKAILEKFKKGGLELTHESLMLAAFTCLKARQPNAAIEYALQAAKAKGAEPCYSLGNFKVLCISAARLGNLQLLAEVIQKGLDKNYRDETPMIYALREARLRLRQVRYGAPGVMPGDQSEGHALINNAMRFLKKERKKLSDDAKRMDKEALEIMRQAALDAGRDPVDFDDIAWLGGGPNGKKKGKAMIMGEEAEEMMRMEAGLQGFLVTEEERKQYPFPATERGSASLSGTVGGQQDRIPDPPPPVLEVY